MQQLTTHRAVDNSPRGSPDGQAIVFGSYRTGDTIAFFARTGSTDLFEVPAAGGEPRAVVTRSRVGSMRWSPVGRLVYFLSPAEDEIWSVSVDDGVERRVARFQGRRGDFGTYALAVTDSHLYFAWQNDTGDIWVMDLEDGETEPDTPFAASPLRTAPRHGKAVAVTRQS